MNTQYTDTGRHASSTLSTVRSGMDEAERDRDFRFPKWKLFPIMHSSDSRHRPEDEWRPGITDYIAERRMERILVIDDDRELCELLSEYLRPEGFEVDAAHTGEDGLAKVWNSSFRIVVLDIMLPGGRNGFDILQQIRARSEIPVIMLTARGEEVDRIVGLEMGADDYLPKPFNPRELIARIRAVLRRSRYTRTDGSAVGAVRKYRIGDVELDMNSRTVARAGEAVKLTGVEYQILEVLLRNYGQVVSREDLGNEVLNRSISAIDRSIDVHVSNLRRKLGPEPGGVERIKAIRGTGYIYTCSFSSEEKGCDPGEAGNDSAGPQLKDEPDAEI